MVHRTCVFSLQHMPLRHELRLDHDEIHHGSRKFHAFIFRPDGISFHSIGGKLTPYPQHHVVTYISQKVVS